MSSPTTILRTVIATAMFAALSLGAAHAASTVRKPGGQTRSAAASIHYAPKPRYAGAPQRPAYSAWGGWVSFGSSSSAASSTAAVDDEVRHTDEINQMISNNDAVNNAIAQADAALAAASQAQNDLINATAPVGPQ